MKLRLDIKQRLQKLSRLKKGRSHLLLLSSFLVPIFLILFLDLYNVEAFTPFNQRFMFELTWKGRMFYLFFAWLLLLEFMLDWDNIIETQHRFHNRFRLLIMFVLAVVPSVYIVAVNFLGLNQTILDFGQALNIRPGFVNEPWPLSVEYLILVLFFTLVIWLAYGVAGLKSFSISLSLLAGIGIIYLVDTAWPYGTLKPMELLAVPTAACATGLLDLLGYNVGLSYQSLAFSPEYGSLPRITVREGGRIASADVAWSCAGVHSLFLYTLIMLVFFKKTAMQRERKTLFFLIGAGGTYLTNILRIASYFIISVNYGAGVGWVFHNSYGELYFLGWMLLYFIVIVTIQSGKISGLAHAFQKRVSILGMFIRKKGSR